MRIDTRPEFTQKPSPLTFGGDVSVATAADAMAESNYGSVVVVNDDGTLAGIFTERDLLRRVVHGKLDADTTPLRDVMSTQVRSANAGDDMLDWLRQMSNERFRHVPVLDEGGRPLKMMSQGDFVSYTWPELLHQMREKAKATITPNYQVGVIVAGVLIYALLVPFAFNFL